MTTEKNVLNYVYGSHYISFRQCCIDGGVSGKVINETESSGRDYYKKHLYIIQRSWLEKKDFQ